MRRYGQGRLCGFEGWDFDYLFPFNADITAADDGFHVGGVRAGGDAFVFKREEGVADLQYEGGEKHV